MIDKHEMIVDRDDYESLVRQNMVFRQALLDVDSFIRAELDAHGDSDLLNAARKVIKTTKGI